MSLERHRREFVYDAWANQAVLQALERAARPPGSGVGWIWHIAGAQALWLARLTGGKSALAVWPTGPLADCSGHLEEQRAAWTRFLDGTGSAGLARQIGYTNSKGESHSSRVDDVLTHVILHGAYHRGQIASALRAADLPVPTTDFIHATRSGLLE